jgi:hypothetical protein
MYKGLELTGRAAHATAKHLVRLEADGKALARAIADGLIQEVAYGEEKEET